MLMFRVIMGILRYQIMTRPSCTNDDVFLHLFIFAVVVFF